MRPTYIRDHFPQGPEGPDGVPWSLWCLTVSPAIHYPVIFYHSDFTSQQYKANQIWQISQVDLLCFKLTTNKPNLLEKQRYAKVIHG